jgi:hypothetical protein
MGMKLLFDLFDCIRTFVRFCHRGGVLLGYGRGGEDADW